MEWCSQNEVVDFSHYRFSDWVQMLQQLHINILFMTNNINIWLISSSGIYNSYHFINQHSKVNQKKWIDFIYHKKHQTITACEQLLTLLIFCCTLRRNQELLLRRDICLIIALISLLGNFDGGQAIVPVEMGSAHINVLPSASAVMN